VWSIAGVELAKKAPLALRVGFQKNFKKLQFSKKNRLSYYVLILKVKRHVFLKVRVDYKSSVDQKSGPTLVPRALGGNANDLQRAS
jgi:hypothetical protein